MLELLMIASLFVFGLDYATQYEPEGASSENPFGTSIAEGEILGRLRFWLGNALWDTPYRWMLKPLLTCVMCMSSFWGTLFYWGEWLTAPTHVNTLVLVRWAVFVVCLCGFNRLVKLIIRMA